MPYRAGGTGKIWTRDQAVMSRQLWPTELLSHANADFHRRDASEGIEPYLSAFPSAFTIKLSSSIPQNLILTIQATSRSNMITLGNHVVTYRFLSALSNRCSVRGCVWSDWRGTIPQHSDWKSDALPIELQSHINEIRNSQPFVLHSSFLANRRVFIR